MYSYTTYQRYVYATADRFVSQRSFPHGSGARDGDCLTLTGGSEAPHDPDGTQIRTGGSKPSRQSLLEAT